MGASRWVVQDKEVALADFEEAMKNGLQRGAENGGAVWCTVWGKSLWRRHGLPIDPRDNAESFEWLKKAVELGDAMAEGAIGFKYFFGSGVPRDVKEMVKWCKMAAEHGDAEAALRLGMYYEAAPVDDWNEASRWYRQAAEQGYDYSACILYKHYQTGSGKDLEEAIKWCRQAVASGWASEADLKSLADFKSLKDERERELQKDKHAAEQGDADAQFRLSSRYSIVEKDDAQAVKWLLKASEQGHARAQSRLGWRYSDGEGVPKDLVRAYMWFDLGAASGNDKAKQEFERISKLMTKEEIADAQQKVREWKRESNDARH